MEIGSQGASSVSLGDLLALGMGNCSGSAAEHGNSGLLEVGGWLPIIWICYARDFVTVSLPTRLPNSQLTPEG